MTFNELVEEVYIVTGRRDFVAETASAIRAATIKAHASDYYSKDILETGVQFTTLEFRQSLDYIAFIGNFRTLKYLRRAESSTDDTGKFFEMITPDEILNAYGNNRNDIAYVAGRVIEIRSSVEFQFILLGAYVLPIVREGAYVSWVAEQFPYAIIYEAARRIFMLIGKAEEANSSARLAAEEFQIFRATALSDTGF